MATSPATLSEPSPPCLAAPLRGALVPPGGRAMLVGASACLALLARIFWPNLRHFAYTWSTDDNYSHGFLVPLLSLYFANEAARRGPVPVRAGVALGTALLVAA